MNKRIYVGKIQEFWKVDSVSHSKLHFKVLFDKDEILEYIIGYAKFCQKYMETIGKKKLNENYDIEITIYEYAYERYRFDYFDGLVSYFNEAIKPSDNIYDNILKCIECNVFKYDINGNLIHSEVYPYTCKYTDITFWDDPLSEDECIGEYTGTFKYYTNRNIDNTLTSKEIIYGLKIIYINIDRDLDLKDKTDSGKDEHLYLLDYQSSNDILNLVKKEFLSIADMYNDDKCNDENQLLNIIQEKFKSHLVEIYEVSDKHCDKIFTTNNLFKLKEK